MPAYVGSQNVVRTLSKQVRLVRFSAVRSHATMSRQDSVFLPEKSTKVLKDGERAPRPTGESTVAAALDHSISHHEKAMSVAERDKALMEAWKDREGSLANAQFEDGQVEEGYRRNVKANIFRYI